VRVLDDLLAAGGLSGAEIVAIDSLTAQKRLIEAGFGLGLVPESSVVEELRLGTLRVVKVPTMRATIPVALIHRRGAYLSRAARQLMGVLAAPPGTGGEPRPAKRVAKQICRAVRGKAPRLRPELKAEHRPR
jgi:DNA-binding transcriptional LysR family regulator